MHPRAKRLAGFADVQHSPPHHNKDKERGQKLVTLLSQHRIGLFGGNAHFVCALADAQGHVNVVIAELPL
jgi:hypothetical protein